MVHYPIFINPHFLINHFRGIIEPRLVSQDKHNASVVQWIECGPPKAVMAVRLCPEALEAGGECGPPTCPPELRSGDAGGRLRWQFDSAQVHHMAHISFPKISSDALMSGSLSSFIPELYAQKKIVEVNPWHDHQSVFDHTVLVVKCVETITQFSFLDEEEKKKVRFSLNERIGEVKRNDIVRLAALFHDIAKSETLEINPLSGKTSCPLHEMKGRGRSVEIMKRWGVSDLVIQKVSKIVLFHGHIHEAVNEILRSDTECQIFDSFHEVVGDIFFELLIEGYADTAGSDLPKLNYADFASRKEIYERALMRYAVSL